MTEAHGALLFTLNDARVGGWVGARRFSMSTTATYEGLLTSANVLSALGTPVTRRGDCQARQAALHSDTEPLAPQNGELPVHFVYKRVRNEGLFDPATRGIRVTAGPLVGRSFGSPSMAAVGVVRAVNPDCAHPERNGWGTWIVTETGRPCRASGSRWASGLGDWCLSRA
ncbi:MAG: hypothetical protein ACRDV9_15400 [Acidimicrobiia bacterium]